MVKNGVHYFDEAVTSLVFEDFYRSRKTAYKNPEITLPHDLTAREEQILALAASGKSNLEIADELFISTKTVDTHKSHIKEKLGLKSTSAMVRYAIKNKLIPLEV